MLFLFSGALIVIGGSRGPEIVAWGGLVFLVIGFVGIYRLTLGRFCCPECGKRISLKAYPKPGGFFRFHCQSCNILWLTGIRVSDDIEGSN
jgi:hypothetical protein